MNGKSWNLSGSDVRQHAQLVLIRCITTYAHRHNQGGFGVYDPPLKKNLKSQP